MSSYASTNATHNWLNRPLAIVGMACRLPGADGLDAYWKLLQHGDYPIESMPDSKLDRDRYFDPRKGVRGKTYADIGGFVAPRELDWSLLNIQPADANDWDECHLNFCEVAARACQHAGYDPRQLPYRNTGVFVGHSGGSTLGGELAYGTLCEDYVQLLDNLSTWQELGSAELKRRLLELLKAGRPQRRAGKPWVDAGFAAGIVSHCLGLTGPHLSIDAACASSLVALALGAMSIHSGETDMAIIGGASFNKTDSLILFSHAQSCSASMSRPFDELADGLISSEGYVALVIKSLPQAEADGDRIHAIIRGIGISTDGRGKSLWAPRKEGQATAIERAYSPEVLPDSIQMIEAHATSTHLGDATEMEALSSFYGPHLKPGQRIPVGSVKSNIGHTLETAGLAGIVKAVLAIEKAVIPPSINVTQPSGSIPWAEIPLYIARRAEPWPALADQQPRRAAVNAFGIGGLNVHVVVEQPPVANQSIRRPASQSGHQRPRPDFAPIAIVGRGVVLPGALSIAAFKEQLHGDAHRHLAPHASPTIPIDDFHYDWRTHKVPPKQIAQANPLQFMLLEAAEQAFREAGLWDRDFDRTQTAVVVGTTFGGDFGNALFAGLRLPEFRQRITELIIAQGHAPEKARKLADDFEEIFLSQHPALLDETGSFTSSTLASRLSKTFNLMGGALAIDAGDCSGVAALNSACQLLHSGTVKLVLCAAAQRALDKAAVENLSQCGRLRHRASSEGYAVGEGVALVLLKPLQDALQDGDKVLATIDDVGVGFHSQSLAESFQAAANRVSHPPLNFSQMTGGVGIRQFDQSVEQGLPNDWQPSIELSPNLLHTGHLQAAQGLVDVIATSLNPTAQSHLIASHTLSGQSYLVAATATPSGRPPARDASPSPHAASATAQPNAPATTYRLAASTLSELKDQLSRLANHPQAADQWCVSALGDSTRWQAALVCQPQQLASKAQKLLALMGNRKAFVAAADQGLLWREPQAMGAAVPTVAWLFPGQGSQYVGMLQSLISSDPVAHRALDEADALLRELGEPSFAELAWQSENQLGENVWHTQAAMLLANWILTQTLRSRGLTPNIVSGHSFGEFAAMSAADCWSLRSALEATRERCRAIVAHAPSGCTMLSIQADSQRVQAAIRSHRLALTVSHRNAPTQTVVGGKQAQIAQLAQRLEEEGIASRVLPVPTAFHTATLAMAIAPFRQSLESIELHPPRTPLLSSVDNRFIAEPASIRDGLAKQLAEPLDFVSLVQRLVDEKITFVFEVGPQQVLTRLIRQTTDRLQAFATDHPQLGAAYQLQIVEAITAMYGLNHPSSQPQLTPQPLSSRPTPRGPIVEFDATQARRARLRYESQLVAQGPSRPAPIAQPTTLHFDATQTRRAEHRQAAAARLPLSSVAPSTPPSPPPSSPPPSSQATSPTPETTSAAAIETFLIDFVVEQTGYPAEIIELDWDIEADLGIDSIKKAQLFGELREFFDLESHGTLKLDDFRTLRQIAVLLQATPGKADWLTPPQSPNLPAPNLPAHDLPGSSAPAHDVPAHDVPNKLSSPAATFEPAQSTPPQAPTTSPEPHSQSNRVAQLSAFLVDFVVEQTGYPIEIIELDADLESDLGIDSIKKTQLFGELRELFAINIAELTSHATTNSTANSMGNRSGLAELRTLRQILSVLVESGAAVESEQSHNQPSTPHFDSQPRDSQPRDSQPSFNSSMPPLLSSDKRSPLNRRLDTDLVSQRIPLWDMSRQAESHEFFAAVSQNIQAMTGRFSGFRPSQPPSNGHWSDYQQRITHLATQCQVLPQCIQALDGALLSESQWSVASVPETTSSGQSPVQWFASISVPKWIMRCGVTFGITQCSSGQLELATPGSATPLAFLNGSLLRIGGLLGTAAPSAQYRLSRTLAQLRGTSLAELQTELENCHLDFDWWIVLGDSSRQALTKLEHRQGQLMAAPLKLASLPTTTAAATTPGPAATPATAAQLGLDTRTGRFVISAQLQPPPYAPIVQDISRQDAASVTSHEDFSGSPLAGEAEPVHASAHHAQIAQRYVLRMAPAPQRNAPGRQPPWAGTAFIAGDNPIARQLEARLRSLGVDVVRHAGSQDPLALANQFTQLCEQRLVPHLFLLTPCDNAAQMSLDASAWATRRNVGLLSNFWLCQKWFEHISTNQLANDASLIAVSSLGGDFGISGNIYSAEGGGIGGLLKSILIESWMQGYRSLPIKTLDTSRDQSPGEIVDAIWRELSIPSYDNEISYIQGNRHVVRAVKQPLSLSARTTQPLTRGGTWVCTGGARGITAFVAEKLAKHADLKLHLLGTAPEPKLEPAWLELDESGLRQLKVQIMTAARNDGQNPVKAWQDTEKLIEIETTLRRLRAQGIEAYYHSCNVAHRAELRRVLDNVRRISGPIQGILHGAGVGKDSRFDRKQPEKVEQCIAAKVDGALALMEATQDDPLEVFVGFGSISGRFGANGHTDYSLANDMLCKTIDWLHRVRPEVRAIGFHWHAWGDVGMATKPETRLALEMIDMQFMPAEEGFEHLIAELEGPAQDSEVLITDDRYYRMFYPAETIVAHRGSASEAALAPLAHPTDDLNAHSGTFTCTVNPAKDPFLTEHLLDGRPLLPFVIAAEMLLEAGQQQLGAHRVALRSIEARSAVRFFSDAPQQLRVATQRSGEKTAECRLLSNFVARDGRVVDTNRLNFVATVIDVPHPVHDEELTRIVLPAHATTSPAIYPERGHKFYVGWPLQRLRKVVLVEGGIVGQISAPALVELAGGGRDVRGWRIPSAALDACLFTVGILAWQQIAPGSALPVRMGQLSLGRLPSPGEACEVHAKLNSVGDGSAAFDFTLYGVDGDLILNVVDYEIAWIASDAQAETIARAEQRG